MRHFFLMGISMMMAFALIQCDVPEQSDDMITHTVYFKLKHEKGSEAEKIFIQKAVDLGAISTVHNLRYVKEISPKNDFDHGLIMHFENQEGYDTYNNHPDHVNFVENVWKKEVVDFMEIDYVPGDL